uniref:Uncharacterized protein n=1 Tax=Arundo donax TaxID=35708 RepID=A0A0A9DT13_ARUDO
MASGSGGPKRSTDVRKGLSRGMKKMIKIQANRAARAEFERELCAVDEEIRCCLHARAYLYHTGELDSP